MHFVVVFIKVCIWMVKGPFNWWKHQLHVGMCFQIQRKKVWIVLQMEVMFLGYWRKRLYIQWFWTLIKLFSSKCNDIFIFLNISCLVISIFYVSHITFGDFFSLKIFVGWKKRHDGNENYQTTPLVVVIWYITLYLSNTSF